MRGPVIYSHTQPEARRLIPSTSPLLSNRYIERVSGCSVPGGVDRNASAHTHAAAAAAASPAIAGAGAGAGAAPAASSTLLPALAHIIIPAGKAHGLGPASATTHKRRPHPAVPLLCTLFPPHIQSRSSTYIGT